MSVVSKITGSFLAPHIVEWYTDIYINVYGLDTTYTDVILKFNTYLKQLINGTTMKTFSNVIFTLGTVLMLIYFFTDLSEKAATKQLSQLQLWKSFATLIMTVFVIFNSRYIFIFLLDMVEGLNTTFTRRIGISSVNKFLNNDTVQLLLSRCVSEHFSLWAIIGYTFSGFLLMLADLGTKIVIMYYAATRTIQLFVYYIFAPIGVADIFENGPGGSINHNSSGFRYLKTILAIMLQIIVIAVVCHSFSLITTTINKGYFEDSGEVFSAGGDLLDPDSNAGVALENRAMVLYPLKNMEYTDHEAGIREIIISGVNKVKETVDTLSEFLSDSDDDSASSSIKEQTVEKIKDNEKYKVTDIILLNGNVIGGKEDKVNEIHEDSKYRMTIQSTERFFDWCIGASSSKIALFIILLATKVIMVISASKICNYIVGVSI